MFKGFEGKRFNGPNDVWNDTSGGMYFTDPLYERDYWVNFKQELSHKSLYYRDNKGKIVKLETFTQPNGIIGSEKLKKLYISDIDAGKLMFTIYSEMENFLPKGYSVKWVLTE